MLGYAVRAKLLDENPASHVPNPEPKRREVPTFESVEDLEAIALELSPTFAAIPIFVGLTGLRCSEWLALERRDIDRTIGVVHVRRVFTDGKLKLYGKQSGSLRTVPCLKGLPRAWQHYRHGWIRRFSSPELVAAT